MRLRVELWLYSWALPERRWNSGYIHRLCVCARKGVELCICTREGVELCVCTREGVELWLYSWTLHLYCRRVNSGYLEYIHCSVFMLENSLITRPSYISVFGLRRLGPFYHVNNISVYLGRQEEGKVSD